MNLPHLDANAIEQIRYLQSEGTITADEARQLLGLPRRGRVTVELFADTSALDRAVAAISRDVHRTIRDIERRSLKR